MSSTPESKKKKVMGIDTGLKNLGVCIMDESQIILWDVYNLLDEPLACSMEGCKFRARWKPALCGHHYKGEKNTASSLKQKKCSSYTPFQVAERVINFIDDIISKNEQVMMELDTIILELQPKINARAKMISHFIYLKVCDFIIKNNLKTTVKFERASYKLKKFNGPSGPKIPNTYANRKRRSIEYTQHVLEEHYSEWISFFNSLQKADDAADSFLICWNCCSAR
jgi:hypothetical protein